MDKQEAKPLGSVLKLLIEDAGLRESLQRIDIYDAWDSAVGARAASATISKYYASGVLYCTISSSILRNQLFYTLEGITRKVNSLIPGAPVKKIVLK